MKLPIKKEFFDRIRNGDKTFEVRDAHLTLICEETGEVLRVEVIDAWTVEREDLPIFGIDPDREDLFEDETQIVFSIRGD